MDVVVQAYNPATWKVEAGVSGVQGYPWLLRKFKPSLGYVRPYLKNRRQNKPLTSAVCIAGLINNCCLSCWSDEILAWDQGRIF